MNVKKEVFDKCKQMVSRELLTAQNKLSANKRQINTIAHEQRILKAQIGELYKTLRLFK
ncbi:MAG TPA: hypothetical protein VIH28_06945 [Ignavibacteriaceae bacterium]